jgi:hypothetical protein
VSAEKSYLDKVMASTVASSTLSDKAFTNEILLDAQDEFTMNKHDYRSGGRIEAPDYRSSIFKFFEEERAKRQAANTYATNYDVGMGYKLKNPITVDGTKISKVFLS